MNRKTWLLAGGALVIVAAAGLLIAPRVTATAVAAAALLGLGWYYVVACIRRSTGVAIVILLTSLLDRSLRGVLAALDVPFASYLTYIDDATLAIAVPFLALHLWERWRRSRHHSRAANRTGQRPRSMSSALGAVPRLAWIGFAVFAASGILSHLVTWSNPAGLLPGTWLALKLPLTILIVVHLRWSHVVVRSLSITVIAVFAIHALVSIVEFLAPGVVHDIFGSSRASARLGFSSLKGIFNHPVQSATFCMFVVAMMLCGPLGRWARLVGYLAGGLAAAGLRVKSLIDIIVVLATRFLIGGRRLTRIFAPVIVAAVAVVVAIVGWDLIAQRFSSVMGPGGSPRAELLTTSFQITFDHLLLGTGFGSYASEAARSSYSPVWEQYGLSDMYGFVEGNAIFATDLSWATVIGESGLIGALGLALALAALAVRLIPRAWRERTGTWDLAALAFLAVIVVDSAASPRLFDGFAAAGLALLLALTVLDPSATRTAASQSETGTHTDSADANGSELRGA